MVSDDAAHEMLAFSLEQAGRAAFLALPAVILIAGIAAQEAALAQPLGWAILAFATLLARNVLLGRAQRMVSEARGMERARAILNTSSLVLALVLGLLPIFVFPALSVDMCLLLTLFFCCWVAAGMSSLGATPGLYTGYLAIVLGCIALGWFRSSDRFPWFIAAGVAMFGTVLRAFAIGFSRRVVEGIAIRAENADLVRQLSLANEAKTRFIMAASHDLRQPLHAISLLGGVLSRAQSADDARSARDALEAAVNGLNRLFSAILDLSRIESGTVRPDLQACELDGLVARLDAEYRALCMAKGRRWECQVERAAAFTDVSLLERVLRNLLDNAMKHGGNGAVQLAVHAGPSLVEIAVSDTGPGIPEQERERVFEEFYRVREGIQPGLGLGLSIVRRLVDLLGGEITLSFTDEARRTGTRLILRLPAADESQARASAEQSPAAEADVAGLAILVMDDEQPVLDATRALLQQWDCRVATCRGPSDIDAALQALGAAPDVAMIDFRLGPDLTGLDAIAGVRDRCPGMGIVVVTGESDSSVIARLAESGLPVLEKPVNPDELRLTLSLFRSCGD